jgi:hypothetical protein
MVMKNKCCAALVRAALLCAYTPAGLRRKAGTRLLSGLRWRGWYAYSQAFYSKFCVAYPNSKARRVHVNQTPALAGMLQGINYYLGD